MSAKVVFVFCAQALFFKLTLSACAGHPNIGAGYATFGLATPITPGMGASSCTGPVLHTPQLPAPSCSGLGYNGIGYGSNLAIEVIPTSGGSLPLSSTSSISSTGLSVVSENVFDGTLFVEGELPFVSAVTLEGVLPTAGSGAISYSCGNGVTAIDSISPSAAAAIAPAAAHGVSFGAGIGAYGATAGIAPLSSLLVAGCKAPVAEITAPIGGCYPTGIYY